MEENSSDDPLSQTIVALFDDRIDAERALAALRKRDLPAASVSVLAKDLAKRAVEDSQIDVTHAVMDTALSASSSWLVGLAALIVPESGIVLAAGPIGVALARMKPVVHDHHFEEGDDGEATVVTVGTAGHALEFFGFPPDESHYLEQRLAAGSVLLAVTTRDEELIDATLRTFADCDAIFLGQAETSDDVLEGIDRWLTNPEGVQEAEVIVADVVATLQSARANAEAFPEAIIWCGLTVTDSDGSRVGEIEDVLVHGSDDPAIRYAIVAYGGVLGLAKRRTAIPAAQLSLKDDHVEMERESRRLSDAPTFDPETPFSRQDELAAHDYFGVAYYWSEG